MNIHYADFSFREREEIGWIFWHLKKVLKRSIHDVQHCFCVINHINWRVATVKKQCANLWKSRTIGSRRSGRFSKRKIMPEEVSCGNDSEKWAGILLSKWPLVWWYWIVRFHMKNFWKAKVAYKVYQRY